MLSLLIVWSVLGGFTLVLGAAALRFFRVEAGNSAGGEENHLFRALWTGLLLLAWLLLVWSLFAPITPITGLALTLGCGMALLLWAELRRDCLRLLRRGYRSGGLMTPLLALGAALAVAQPMSNRDALAYHLDLIQIMSRVGLVPGLGLIHDRFGFVSSWFAIPALFNHGPLSGRVGVVANGYAFFLMLAHLRMAATRVLRGRGDPADWFVSAALSVGVLFPVYLGFPVGSTADFAVLLYILIVAWTALTVYSPGAVPPSGFRDPRLLPLFMGALLFSVKLSAIPVPAVAGVLYLISCRFRLRAFVTGGTFTALLIPWFSASIVVTGFLMYPGPWRLNLPWTMGHHQALEITHWGQPGRLAAPSPSLDWLRRWLSLDVTHQIGFAYFLAGVVFLLCVLLRHRRRLPDLAPLLLTGIFGVAFMWARAPSVRFGWGYLVILPCAFFPLYGPGLNVKIQRLKFSPPMAGALAFIACLAILFGLSLPGWTESAQRVRDAVREGRLAPDDGNRLLRPPIPPRIRFDDVAGTVEPDTRHVEDPRAYLDGPRAMTYPLIPPCGVHFRDPEAGPRRGFRHE